MRRMHFLWAALPALLAAGGRDAPAWGQDMGAPLAEAVVPAAPMPSLPGGFSFKRIKVSDIRPGRRITVQIDPAEQAALLAAARKIDPHPHPREEAEAAMPLAPLAPLAPLGAHYDWYWTLVAPGLGASEDRLPLALAALGQGPGGSRVEAPRLQTLQGLAQTWGTEILRQTVGTRVSPALVLAVMAIESGGNPKATSSAGAQGLMQLIPGTARRFGVADPLDGAQNIRGGVAYLDWLMGNFDRDPLMVLAAYNAGEGAVSANGGVPPYAETRDYVPKVLAAWQVAQGLCLTPPELMSDPCVFNVLSATASN